MLSERRSSFSTPVEPLGRGRKGGEGMVPGLCLLDSPPVSPAREEEDGQWKEEQKLEAHSDWVRDVAWAPSIGLPTSTIASCSQVSSDPCRHPTLISGSPIGPYSPLGKVLGRAGGWHLWTTAYKSASGARSPLSEVLTRSHSGFLPLSQEQDQTQD